ncbi:unnamed protein product [Dicrocoelium dendriticum]|nr:unnamed protein product [Dicrocoelium dendriticum]
MFSFIFTLLFGSKCVSIPSNSTNTVLLPAIFPVEVHDGHDGSPVISRSNSRASGIPAQDVLGTIGDLAFQRSDYPLIISIECFASPHQQFTLANLLVYYLGQRILPPSSQFEFTLGEAQLEVEEHVEKHFDPYRKNSLTTVDLSNEATLYSNDGLHVRWPSPRDLIGRILLKGKRLPKGYSGQVGSDVGVGADVRGAPFRSFSHSVYNPQSSTVIKELSDLFFFDCTNCTSFSTKGFRKSNPSLTINSTNATPTHSSAQVLTKTNPHLKTGPSLLVVGTHNDMGFPGRRMTPGITTASPYDKCFNKTDVSRVHPYHFIQLSETEASKALGQAAGELVQITRNSFFEIVPSPSRADSSNLNPIDIWAWGGQVVPLNYQTAGLVMDLATGFFARNGACGPFSSHSELHQKPPDTTPQIFRLKILSAQQLPKPRGSVSKGDTIEPYVVVEIHGIPVDCEEQRTPTAPAGNASGYSATFNETFEFCVQLGSLALVRFVVLDDHAIGDDFIGQNTIPFDCLLSGYRHVRLRGDTGEPIPLATLFIHVTITSRTEEGSDVQATGVLQRWRTKKRQHIQLKKVGASNFDEIFKLSSVLRSVSRSDRLFLLGDFNAHVERDASVWTDVMGSYGIGSANAKGDWLLLLCVTYGLTLTNTRFALSASDRATWAHPRSGHAHLLDYAIVRQRDMREMRMTRVLSGAERDTAHKLVQNRLYICFGNSMYCAPAVNRRTFNHLCRGTVAKRIGMEKALAASLCNMNCVATVGDLWYHIRDQVTAAAKETIGRANCNRPDWFA